jgi:aspartate/methionine/tyrosine aminotransferase
VLLVNAPNNPTGWTLTRAEQQAILAHCRRTGTWIVADEVYERVWFGEGAPPRRASWTSRGRRPPRRGAQLLEELSDDRLAPGLAGAARAALLEAAGKLLEFNSSCSPVFVQRGALAALETADQFVPGLVQRLQACRDRLHQGLARLPPLTVARPQGGLYAWFRVAGEDDSLALAKRLVREQGLGLAPGVAFGPEGEGWLRWCFASREPARLDAGLGRLASALGL